MESYTTQSIQKHPHNWKEVEKYNVCSICGLKRLKLSQVEGKEGLLQGVTKDGINYSVRSHRKSYLTPDVWIKMYDNLGTDRARFTAQMLIQTGARIAETSHVELRDIDFDRNTLVLRVTKRKARKKGEERGIPRTIPLSSQFTKELKKHFNSLPEGSKADVLQDSPFNIAFKKSLKKIGIPNYYMFSAHNIRKTHGNWLKILGSLRVKDVTEGEICLRLGHDYNTFLKDYGSSSVFNEEDIRLATRILGDLYAPRT